MSLYEYVPHPHLKHRAENGPVKVGAAKPDANIVVRINTRAAVIVTRGVGTMWCAYAFCLLAFYGLPAGLHGGAAGFVQWASSQFIQLVLLPIIIVGAAVLAEATDRMNKRQFDDVEALLHGQSEQAAHLAAQDERILAIVNSLDTSTPGGVTAILDAVKALGEHVSSRDAILEALAARTSEPVTVTLGPGDVKSVADRAQEARLRQAKRNPRTGGAGVKA